MAETTIEWTATPRTDGTVAQGFTFNPWLGCQHVHAGCTNCYAESYAKRYGKAVWGGNGSRVKTSENYWLQPLKWNRDAEKAGERRRVFCASLADVFEDWTGPIIDAHGERLIVLPDVLGRPERVVADGLERSPVHGQRDLTMTDLRRDLFALIDKTPSLDWLLLTKRPENVRQMWTYPSPYQNGGTGRAQKAYRPNVWLGTSVSNQATFDKQAAGPAQSRDLCPVLFLSVEPLLGPISCEMRTRPPMSSALTAAGIRWVIVGGESGHGARACNVAWIRSLVEQCRAANVACFVKQLGSHPIAGGDFAQKTGPMEGIRLRDKKGGDWSEWDADLRVRQFPEVLSQ